MAWQPIDTAPKDGTWVLLCGGNTNEYDFDDEMLPCHSRPVVAHWNGSDWAYGYWDGAWRSCYEKPTHWMPTPEPHK